MNERIKRYGWLFLVNLYISAFTFGGGYVAVPMLRRFFVERKQLLSEEELINIAAIAQSAPGAIAINLSALAGYKTARTAGALISCFAAIIPPLIILSLISVFYQMLLSNSVLAAILKGMEAGVAALMIDLIIDMCAMILKKKSLLLSMMIPLSFIASYVLHINVVLILLFCCIAAVSEVSYMRRKKA